MFINSPPFFPQTQVNLATLNVCEAVRTEEGNYKVNAPRPFTVKKMFDCPDMAEVCYFDTPANSAEVTTEDCRGLWNGQEATPLVPITGNPKKNMGFLMVRILYTVLIFKVKNSVPFFSR